jgi:hypothetical protein
MQALIRRRVSVFLPDVGSEADCALTAIGVS